MIAKKSLYEQSALSVAWSRVTRVDRHSWQCTLNWENADRKDDGGALICEFRLQSIRKDLVQFTRAAGEIESVLKPYSDASCKISEKRNIYVRKWRLVVLFRDAA